MLFKKGRSYRVPCAMVKSGWALGLLLCFATSSSLADRRLTLEPLPVSAVVGLFQPPTCPVSVCAAESDDPRYAEASFSDLVFASTDMESSSLRSRARLDLRSSQGVVGGYEQYLGYRLRNTGSEAVAFRLGTTTQVRMDGSNLSGPNVPGRVSAGGNLKTTVDFGIVNTFNLQQSAGVNAVFGSGYTIDSGNWKSGVSTSDATSNGTTSFPMATDTEIRFEYTTNTLVLQPRQHATVFMILSGGGTIVAGHLGSYLLIDSMNTTTTTLNVLTPGVELSSPFPLSWVSVVPEPASAALMLLGLGFGLWALRRRCVKLWRVGGNARGLQGMTTATAGCA